MTRLYSIMESPTHPDASVHYHRLGLEHQVFRSVRKAIAALKREPPDWVVAEFFYGYGNNYAGANLGNLDVFLASLQRYAPSARVVVMVDKAERPWADRLGERFPLHAVLEHPVTAEALAEVVAAG
ncbi:hypothetical protein [Thiohalobacter sp.]|uniref:hypothetical protein n=1 Tax=Thiohalobacter sp. TaxID=2025948 RepID=UPI002612E46B|nr:hypothetical protein [Thiohalobacter sp.]